MVIESEKGLLTLHVTHGEYRQTCDDPKRYRTAAAWFKLLLSEKRYLVGERRQDVVMGDELITEAGPTGSERLKEVFMWQMQVGQRIMAMLLQFMCEDRHQRTVDLELI